MYKVCSQMCRRICYILKILYKPEDRLRMHTYYNAVYSVHLLLCEGVHGGKSAHYLKCKLALGTYTKAANTFRIQTTNTAISTR